MLGDKVAIWDPFPGTDEPFITSIIGMDAKNNVLIFMDDVGEVNTGEKAKARNTLIYNLTKSNNRFYVKNNHIKSNARFGMLISSMNGVVADNIFERCAASAIRIGNYPGEGLMASNLLFKNNLIKDCGYTGEYFDDAEAAIQITAFNAAHKEVALKLHSNISFVNNRIEGWESGVFTLRGATNVLFMGNVISDGGHATFSPLAKHNNVYVIENAANVVIKDNILEDQRDIDHYIIKDEESTEKVAVESMYQATQVNPKKLLSN